VGTFKWNGFILSTDFIHFYNYICTGKTPTNKCYYKAYQISSRLCLRANGKGVVSLSTYTQKHTLLAIGLTFANFSGFIVFLFLMSNFMEFTNKSPYNMYMYVTSGYFQFNKCDKYKIVFIITIVFASSIITLSIICMLYFCFLSCETML